MKSMEVKMRKELWVGVVRWPSLSVQFVVIKILICKFKIQCDCQYNYIFLPHNHNLPNLVAPSQQIKKIHKSWIEKVPRLVRYVASLELTLRTRALVLLIKIVFALWHFSDIVMAISRFTEPIPGMFVLIWMYFSWWFQIWSWNSQMLTFFTKFVKFVTCRLHSPAAW